jgi:hypothetical protein
MCPTESTRIGAVLAPAGTYICELHCIPNYTAILEDEGNRIRAIEMGCVQWPATRKLDDIEGRGEFSEGMIQ